MQVVAMFGWNGPRAQKDPFVIPVEKVLDVVERTFHNDLMNSVQRSQRICQQIVETGSDIKDILATIESVSLSDSSRSAVLTAWIARMKQAIGPIKIPRQQRPELLAFQTSVNEFLAVLRSVDTSSMRDIVALRQPLLALAAKTTIIASKDTELHSAMSGEQGKLFHDVQTLAAEIKKVQESMSQLAQDIVNIEKTIPFLTEEVKKSERDLAINKSRLGEIQSQDFIAKKEPIFRAMTHAGEQKANNERQIAALKERRQKKIEEKVRTERALHAKASQLTVALSELFKRDVRLDF